jgi:hypothetical protein
MRDSEISSLQSVCLILLNFEAHFQNCEKQLLALSSLFVSLNGATWLAMDGFS